MTNPTEINPIETTTNQIALPPRRTMHRLAWALVAVGCGLTGQYFLSQEKLTDGLVCYGLALILFIWAMYQQTKVTESIENLKSKIKNLNPAPLRRYLGLLLMVAAIGSSYFAYRVFTAETNNAQGWWFYLYSLILFSGGIFALTTDSNAFTEIKRLLVSRKIMLGLIFTLLLALFMRLFRLSDLPLGIWYDESFVGLEARHMITDPTYRPLFFMNHSTILFMTYALALKWLGDSIYAMRLVSVALGVGGVGAAYLFGRELRGPRFGLALAFILAVSRWHINFSRIAITNVEVTFFEFLSLFFLVRLLKWGKWRDALGAGLAIGFGLMVYTAFRLYVIVLIIFVLLSLIFWQKWWYVAIRNWQMFLSNLLILGLSVWLVIMPLARFAQNHPEEFFGRTREVSIFNKRDQPILSQAVWESTKKHLLMFNYRGDRNGRHNLPGEPMLDPLMGVLAVLGFGLTLAGARRPINLFFLLLFPMAISAGIFSLDFEAPQSHRSTAVIPVVIYFITLAIATLGREAEQILKPLPKQWLIIPTALAASFLIGSNGYTYFVRQANDFSTQSEFSLAETLSGRRMAQLGPNYVYITSPFLTNHPSIRFLAPQATDQRRLIMPDVLPVREPPDRPVALFIHPDDAWIFERAKQFYPNAQFETASIGQDKPPVVYFINLQTSDLASLQGVELRYRPTDEAQAKLFIMPAQRVQNINVTWPNDVPPALKDANLPYTAEWQGVLYVPAYGPHSFRLLTPAHGSLEIDGNVVLDGAGQQTIGLPLAQGNHALVVKADGANGQIALYWQPPSQTEMLVTTPNLYAPPVSNHGLLGTFYANDRWEGQPVLQRIDPFLDVYFHFTPLNRPYTVDWSGALLAPQSGVYRFGLKAILSAELLIDKQPVVTTAAPNQLFENSLNLEVGLHELVVRFKDNADRSQIHLYWTPPTGVSQPIPTENLWPPMGKYTLPTPPPVDTTARPLTLNLLSSIGGPGASPGQFAEPRDVAVLSNGNIVVADTGNKRVQIFDPQGQPLQQLTGDPHPFDEPLAVAVNSRDEIFVLESNLQWIYRYDANGQFINRFGGPEAHLFHPRGLTVFADDTFAVADTGGARFVLFGQDGMPLGNIGGLGQGPGQLNEPVDILRDAQGTYFVSEAENDRVQRLDGTGNPLGQWIIPPGVAYNGSHMAFGPDGSIFMTAADSHALLRYAPNGNQLDRLETVGAVHLVMPVGLYFHPPTQRLYVTDIWTHQVHVFEVRP